MTTKKVGVERTIPFHKKVPSNFPLSFSSALIRAQSVGKCANRWEFFF